MRPLFFNESTRVRIRRFMDRLYPGWFTRPDFVLALGVHREQCHHVIQKHARHLDEYKMLISLGVSDVGGWYLKSDSSMGLSMEMAFLGQTS